MIARVWKGRTPAEKGVEYFDYLKETGVEQYGSTQGNLGVYVLRLVENGVAEFLLLTLWDSPEAIGRFAGPNPERAVYYPKDEEYLLELEPNVTHYDVLLAPGGP